LSWPVTPPLCLSWILRRVARCESPMSPALANLERSRDSLLFYEQSIPSSIGHGDSENRPAACPTPGLFPLGINLRSPHHGGAFYRLRVFFAFPLCNCSLFFPPAPPPCSDSPFRNQSLYALKWKDLGFSFFLQFKSAWGFRDSLLCGRFECLASLQSCFPFPGASQYSRAWPLHKRSLPFRPLVDSPCLFPNPVSPSRRKVLRFHSEIKRPSAHVNLCVPILRRCSLGDV